MLRHFGLGLLSLFVLACSSGQGDSDAGQDSGSDIDAHDAGSDSGSGGDGDLLVECVAGLQATGPWGFLVVQSFESQDQSRRMRIALEPRDDATVGETIPYHLIRFAYQDADGGFCVDQESELDYEWGHHNWDEIGKARHADVEYTFTNKLDIIGPGGWLDTIEARSLSGGELLWGPLTLTDTGCGTIPAGNPNACIHRVRTDQ